MLQWLTANSDSDITLSASSGDSDSVPDYVESPENSPTRLANSPENEGHILELQHMQEVAEFDTEEINQPTNIFTQPN